MYLDEEAALGGARGRFGTKTKMRMEEVSLIRTAVQIEGLTNN